MTSPTNEADLAWEPMQQGENFQHRRKPISTQAGGQEIGCSLYEVDPGKRPFPYHYHCGNEEAVYVLAGTGSLRLPDETVAICAGDYVALPEGPDACHQVINTSDEVLRYLCMSTMRHPDVCVYPDSKKLGVFGGAAPGRDSEERYLTTFVRSEPQLPYFEGES